VFQLFHRSGTEAERLVGRYLDPAHSWSDKEDARLRALLRDDDGARAHYDRSVAIHRAALGTDPAQPSGFESRRMMAAVVDATSAPRTQRSTASVRGWTTALAAAAIAILVIKPWAPAPVDSIQSRGAAEERLEAGLVGVGVSGVPARGGVEYEVIASKRVTQGDYLRFSYSNERNELGHLFVFGLQERKAPYWYAPMPPFENRSLAISHATGQTLPFEAEVGADHRRGRLRIISIFSERSLSLDEATAKLGPGLFAMADGELSDAVHQRLGLSDRAVVQVLETRVEIGRVK
jgi:hypothetical protein